ncbi:MAG: FAD binding domain-containing protein [Nitrospinota bacterium]
MFRLPFEVVHPATVAEAAEFLSAHQGEAKVMAGGSDLMVSLNQRLLSFRYLVDIQGLPELRRIVGDSESGLRIGALATLREVERSPLVRRLCPLLVQAAGKVGSVQIRNLGTLGGNVCLDTRCWYYNQTDFWRGSKPPCIKEGGEECYVVRRGDTCYALHGADTVPPLIALDAQVRVVGVQGEGVRPVESLFTGDGKSPLTLGPDELVAEVLIPPASLFRRGVYIKYAPKDTIAYPLVGVAVALELDSAGWTCQRARIVIGGVAAAPLRVPSAEKLLCGLAANDDEWIAEAAHVGSRSVKIYSDVYASAGYKRKMIRTLIDQAVRQVFCKDPHPTGRR